LVKISPDITGGVQSGYCRALTLVDVEVSNLTARRTESNGKFRSHIAGERHRWSELLMFGRLF
jgi:hypothetical protein